MYLELYNWEKKERKHEGKTVFSEKIIYAQEESGVKIYKHFTIFKIPLF